MVLGPLSAQHFLAIADVGIAICIISGGSREKRQYYSN